MMTIELGQHLKSDFMEHRKMADEQRTELISLRQGIQSQEVSLAF
jgi:hypothetical protein